MNFLICYVYIGFHFSSISSYETDPWSSNNSVQCIAEVASFPPWLDPVRCQGSLIQDANCRIFEFQTSHSPEKMLKLNCNLKEKGKVQILINVIKAIVYTISILKAFFCPSHCGIEPLKCIRISELGLVLRTFIKWQYPPHITFNTLKTKLHWIEKNCKMQNLTHQGGRK